MTEAVTLTFIFQTIGVILGVTGALILLVNYKTKKMRKN